MELSLSLIKLLRSVDTPTVCNAIELAQGKRGFSGFTRQTVLIADLALPSLVGYARTARIKASVPSTESPETVRATRMGYYRYMHDGPLPGVCVIEDSDYPQCVGAFWGEVNTQIHKSFRLSGTLTNGIMRDLGDLASDYQVIAGSIGPSHGFVHVLDYGQPVEVFGLSVKSDDFIHADRHGAVVIPPEVIKSLETSIEKLITTEKIIIDVVKDRIVTFEEFEQGWSNFENFRT